MSQYPSPNASGSSTPGNTSTTAAVNPRERADFAGRRGGYATRDSYEPYPTLYQRAQPAVIWQHTLAIGAVRALYLGKSYREVAEAFNMPEGMAFATALRVRDADPEELLQEILAADAKRTAR